MIEQPWYVIEWKKNVVSEPWTRVLYYFILLFRDLLTLKVSPTLLLKILQMHCQMEAPIDVSCLFKTINLK